MLNAINLRKTYTPKRGVPVKALDGVSLEFGDTGLVFILGKSGSGKSTLLNVLGGLDSIDDGEIEIKGRSCKNFKQGDFDSYRNTFVGFIFQEYNILNEFTIGANIALALQLQGKKATNERVNEILKEVDLDGYGDRKPNELSGGQKQRVAIARALIKDPQIIMADEPTGALDSNTGKQVFDTLKKLAKTKLVIVVSHDREFAEYYGDRVIELADGKVISDITKYSAPAESYSEGLDILDNKIIHIKKGYRLTPTDLQRIAELVNQADSDTVMSIDSRTNDSIKQIAMFDEDGKASFKDTSKEDVKSRTYNDKESKFIKAKFPFRHALKMGASNLKVKPFRLFLTILLSCIAFVLFGVVDTAAAYDKAKTATQSIIDQNIEFAMVEQKEYYAVDYGSGEYVTYNNILFNDADIDKLMQKTGISFNGVIGGNSYSSGGRISFNLYNQMIDSNKIYSNSGTHFYSSEMNAVTAISKADVEAMGFEIHGEFPKEANEILLPMYYYDAFKYTGFKDKNSQDGMGNDVQISADELTYLKNDANSIIGKTISFTYGDYSYANHQATIVGVVDTHYSTEGFEKFMPQKGAMSDNDYMASIQLESYLGDSMHKIAIVAPSFIKNLENNGGESSSFPSWVDKVDSFIEVEYIRADGERGYNSIRVDGYAKNEYLSNVEFVTQNDENKDTGLYLPSHTIFSFANDFLYNMSYNATVKVPNIYGDYDEQTYSTMQGYFDSGIEVEATVEYVSTLSKTNVDKYFKAISDDLGYDFESYTTAKKRAILAAVLMKYRDITEIATLIPELDRFVTKEKMEFLDTNNVLNMNNVEFKIYVRNKVEILKYAGYYIPGAELTSQDNYNQSTVIFSDVVANLYGNDGREKGIYTRAVGLMPKTETGVRQLVNLCCEEGLYEETGEYAYELKNSVMSALGIADGFVRVMSDILFYVSIGLAFFAALLLWNYISVSVTSKRREIGILRAVGAKSIDVFMIFFLESLIIGLIAFIISTVGCGVAVYFISNAISGEAGLGLTLFVFEIRQIALLLGISIVVSFLGSFIPSYSISQKKPIDAIADR